MIKRAFIPGNEWIYFKIYTGCRSADDILTGPIYHYVQKLLESGVIRLFFFIRYADPAFHIRLRLWISNEKNYTESYGFVFKEFGEIFEQYLDNCMINNVQCDTYRREVERYGLKTIELSEEFFYYDSIAIIDLLRNMYYSEDPDMENRRWQLSLILIDSVLDAFGYDTAGKISLTKELSENFKKELNFTSARYTKQTNDKYRNQRAIIDKTMSKANMTEEYSNILNARYAQIQRIAMEVKKIEKGSEHEIENLLKSYVHMTMNRLFKSKNRLHEMVIYEFLYRHYHSVQAKSKYMNII